MARVKETVAGIAALVSISCRETSRLQSLALDQRLPWRQRTGLRIHLALCKWCRRYGKQIAFLRQAASLAGHDEHSHVHQTLSDEARERIRQSLRSSQG